MKMFTVDTARQGCKELFEEGYGFTAVRIYLYDLARSKDITWDDVRQIMHEIMDSGVDCSFATL